MNEIRSEIIEGAVVKHVFEDANGDITAILFQKSGKNYKLFIPITVKTRLIKQVDWI